MSGGYSPLRSRCNFNLAKSPAAMRLALAGWASREASASSGMGRDSRFKARNTKHRDRENTSDQAQCAGTMHGLRIAELTTGGLGVPPVPRFRTAGTAVPPY